MAYHHGRAPIKNTTKEQPTMSTLLAALTPFIAMLILLAFAHAYTYGSLLQGVTQ